MGGMINSVEMDQPFSILLRGVVFVVCAGLLPAASVLGEERSHPSLVDPTITKCTVCHTEVAETHSGIAASQGCLSCHTLIEKSGKTILIVEANRQLLGVDETSTRTGSSNEGFKPEGAEGVAPPKATAGGPQPTPAVDVAAAAVSAAQQSSSLNAKASAGGGAARSSDTYEIGRREFNRGDFDSAIGAWSMMIADNPDLFTLQVEVDSYFISVQSTIARYGDHSLFVLKKDDLFVVFSGLFATLTEANEALKLLPEPLRRGGAFPIAVRQIVLHE